MLVAVTALAYQPAWTGTPVWDDDAHLTPLALSSAAGLGRIWTDLSASQQYYPVTGTAFWVMNALWGHAPLGYHLVNIGLHAFSAFLIAWLLRRWSVPGAALAAVVFALHPVHVESVAWMSELKNTLSTVFYLLAARAYVKFDEQRTRREYIESIVWFLLAVGSKTVTASLPAALLVAFWWRRGRLGWTLDIRPLLPFFAVGAAAGIGTAYLESAWVGASGESFSLSALERLLLAGRAVWFYFSRLLWPSDLMFVYPRWIIDAGIAWQSLFPLSLGLALAGLWLMRGRSRAPLAAALFFCGTLFPVLGFLNVYPFRFSYVADHFQYLASIGVIAAIAAALVSLARPHQRRGAEAVLIVGIGAVLFGLTRHESAKFSNADTLYRETIAVNPDAAMARTNLSALLLDGPATGWREALMHAEAATRLSPDSAEAHSNLGLAYERLDRLEDAEREQREAIRLKPEFQGGHYNLGVVLARQGRFEAAAEAYEQSLKLFPDDAKALGGLGLALASANRIDEAIARLRQASTVDPDSADVRLALANALLAAGALPEAVAAYEAALGLRPDWGEAHYNMAVALRRAGRQPDALRAFEAAARLMPESFTAAASFAAALGGTDRLEDAARQYARAIALAPPDRRHEFHNELGVIYARMGRVDQAAQEFRQALALRPGYPQALANLQKVGRPVRVP